LDETQQQIVTEQIEGSFTGDVVITPGCLENILWFVGDVYLQDGAMISGTSPWKDRLGERVASPLVNFSLVAEHPELPAAGNLSGDGYVAENMPLTRLACSGTSASAVTVLPRRLRAFCPTLATSTFLVP
jgi:PmbA protein